MKKIPNGQGEEKRELGGGHPSMPGLQRPTLSGDAVGIVRMSRANVQCPHGQRRGCLGQFKDGQASR